MVHRPVESCLPIDSADRSIPIKYLHQPVIAQVPEIRIRPLNSNPVDTGGVCVLYWMTAFRRLQDNFALQRSIAWAEQLQKPLLIFEPLRLRYPWASERLHRFVIQGMADNDLIAKSVKSPGVMYYPFVEQKHGELADLFSELHKKSCVVVTDDYPCFFLPTMAQKAANQCHVLMESVDSNGIIPLQAADQTFYMAFHFRRWLQKNIRPFLSESSFPHPDPLAGLKLPKIALPSEICDRFPRLRSEQLRRPEPWLKPLPIDHDVRATQMIGGTHAAIARMRHFLNDRLPDYLHRNDPSKDGASGLSPYLHFGHISVHTIVRQAFQNELWSIDKLADKATGKSEGWWGTSLALQSFLDELITWRELGFNFASHRKDYDRYESLPDWAKKTLAEHSGDQRPHRYSLDQFEHANTHDALWNAAQRQLLREGKIHNYLRMLWGKKILEWSESPQQALAIMIELNNKYALDGRDPNSYSGIFWTLGRFDRPWAPQRPIFGMIRYMSSDNTARKINVRGYLAEYSSIESGLRQQELF
jgi:deoxyribodipyrimidine photo-lyase